MHRTAKIIYCPPGRTDEVLLYHIEDFADLARTSRREIDRMIADDEIGKVKWRGVTLIPALELVNFATEETETERPERREQQAGRRAAGTEAQAEHGPKATSATPWEELSYDAR
ncbi:MULTISPECIES: hypothetical protein [Glycomyces]|uniref:Helix-turn-helix domain-containing protein n=2 Tax=Glycomyces TaxID=58113 RepID=A0ABU2AHT0_9ACTN|nr:hypothetical protein [Glycomyces lechevalierae]MDR7336771.1 hypothetical protein [Glycomyces lechevalierae]